LKNKKYFFLISCFLLTQVDKLLNTPRMLAGFRHAKASNFNIKIMLHIAVDYATFKIGNISISGSEEGHFLGDLIF